MNLKKDNLRLKDKNKKTDSNKEYEKEYRNLFNKSKNQYKYQEYNKF